MQQPDSENGPMLSPEIAESLLHGWLASRKLYPSQRLARIFAEAGRLAVKREPGRRLVSTRLLLLAAGELGTQAGTEDAESRVLKAVADFLQGDPDKLDSFLATYFDEEKVPSGKPAALSANVEKMLRAAISSPGPDAGPDVVSATSFLLAYPLEGSKAEDLIRSFEDTPGGFRAAIRAALRPPPPPTSGTGPTPTSTSTPPPPPPPPPASSPTPPPTSDPGPTPTSTSTPTPTPPAPTPASPPTPTSAATPTPPAPSPASPPTPVPPDSTDAEEKPPGKAPRKKRQAKTFSERVSTHTDEPATADQLGRRNFAEVLALRIKQAMPGGDRRNLTEELALRIKQALGRGDTRQPKKQKAGDEGQSGTKKRKQQEKRPAFIVHLHGPWGSGKSSVLNFLEEELEQNSDPPWIVVNYNAWRQQRLQPPWWTLITTIYSGARAKLGWRAPMLWLRWQMWRVRADYMPLLAVLAFVSLLVLTAIGLGILNYGQATARDQGFPPWFDTVVKLAPIGITILAAIYVGSRTLALGSRRAAQTYADLKDDPYKPIAKLFEDLVGAINRPLAVFVDDLDRCSPDYVVDLLEGVQTLMRGAPVTYVVAADRKWICSSFEQKYSGFSGPIGEPGRPLGYLFLDKMFQISAAIPQPSPEAKSSYWLNLLNAPPQALERHEADLRKAEEAADKRAKSVTRPEAMRALVEDAEKQARISNDPLIVPATRAAVAKQIASQAAAPELEHRLKSFSDLVEPNPRAMKRLVNAYAMHQSTLFLSGSKTMFNTLARWTILELRWPQLADFLATRPECVDALRTALGKDDLPQVPEPLRRLFGDRPVVDVLGKKGSEGALDSSGLHEILGSVQGDR